jgi:hypothetical protein
MQINVIIPIKHAQWQFHIFVTFRCALVIVGKTTNVNVAFQLY